MRGSVWDWRLSALLLTMASIVGLGISALGATFVSLVIASSLTCIASIHIRNTLRRQLTQEVYLKASSFAVASTTSYVAVGQAAVLALYLQTLDIHNRLRSESNLRFFVVSAFILIVGWIAIRSGDPAPLKMRDRLLGSLTGYMVLGSLVGRFYLDTERSALTAALPLLLAIIPLPMGRLSREDILKLTHSIARALTALVVISAMARLTPLLGEASRSAFSHEKAHLFVAALFALWALRKWTWFCLTGALFLGIFTEYPAATYGLALSAGIALVCVTSARPAARRIGAALGFALVLVATYSATNTGSVAAVTSRYFELAGKTNNDSTRQELMGAAAKEIRSSPLVGSLFTGDTTVAIPRSRAVVVDGVRLTRVGPHNIYLEVWMLGGVVAIGLLVYWLLLTIVDVVRFCHGDASAEAKTLARVLLLIVGGFFAVGLVNPILDEIGNTLILAAAYLCLRLVLSDKDMRPPSPALSSERDQSRGVPNVSPRA